ncbi:MAG: AMP-binding protein, partial [Xanthobacteraceae bacterium]
MIERLTADAVSLRGALRTLRMTTPIARHPTRVFPQVILELADRYGDAPALLSDSECFSYRELAARSNRYARWALAQDLRKGDTVCLMMPGRPEFLAIWVGITRVGGVVALINTHLTGSALAYCINAVSPKHIIVAAELFGSLETARAHIAGDAQIWLHGNADANFARIDREIEGLSDA